MKNVYLNEQEAFEIFCKDVYDIDSNSKLLNFSLDDLRNLIDEFDNEIKHTKNGLIYLEYEDL